MSTAAGQLLISGTAAVVGSASRHGDDVAAQLDETITNIASLIRTAAAGTSALPGTGSVLKIYVRRRDDAARVVTRLRETGIEPDGLLILHGDICRSELLVEIDGLHD
jgi:chorismate lyase/3-hydroxybenzoate synthase